MSNKAFKTIDEQIDILKNRGMVINDIDKKLYELGTYQGRKYKSLFIE